MNKKQRAKELVLSVYQDSKDFYSTIRNEWSQLYKLSVGEANRKKGKKFNRFVPVIPAYIDLVLPRLAGRLPIFNTTGRSPDDHDHAELMDEVVQYFLDKTNFHEFELNFVRQAIVYGTAIAQIGWDLQKKSVHPDMAETTGEQEIVYKDEPLYTIVPIENVFPHRKKVKIDDEWGIVIREEVSRRDLKNDPNIDNASLGQVGAPMNEDEWFSQVNRNTSQTDESKNPTDNPDDDVLVKLTYWGNFDGEESVITVVNGQVVVRQERNPFWHQCKPFAKLDYQPNTHNFYSEGLVKELKDLQLELNELRNVRSVARAIALKTPLLVDRNANVNLQELVWENSAVWLYDASQNPNPIKEMRVETKLLDLNQEEETVIRDMQLRSGINDVITGGNDVQVQGGDTATGASIAAEQTSLRFKTQSILIDNAIKEIGNQTIANIQQFVDQEMVFSITGDESLEWRQYDPTTMRQFRFDFQVAPMSTFVEPKTAKREKLLQLKQLYDEDPTVDQDKLDRMIMEAFDMDADQLKKSSEEIAQIQASGELEEVANQINSPEFAQMPPEEQQLLVDHMNTIRSQVEPQEEEPVTA